MSAAPRPAATTDADAPAPAPGPGPRMSRRRRALVWALIVAASVIAVISVLTTWVDRQMLDEEAWRKASAQMIEDPQVQRALAVFLVDEAYDKADVSGALEQRVRPAFKPLVAPAAAALRQPATDAVERLLASGRVQQGFVDASVFAQRKLLNVLEDETGYGITTGDGVVTLDLRELVTVVAGELGVPPPSLSRLPPDAGVITVARSSELATAQQGLKALKILSVALLVLVLVLYAAAILLARGERRRTLRNVGWALILVGLVILATRRLGGSYAVDALTQPGSRAAGDRVWTIGTSILAPDRLGGDPVRRGRPLRRDPGRSDIPGDVPPAPAGARPERPGRDRLGDRRGRPAPAGDLGADACAAHRLGRRALRPADGGGRRRAAPPDARGVPGRTAPARPQGGMTVSSPSPTPGPTARREAAGKATDRPNLVFGGDVHVVWEKFCRYFDVEPRIIPLQPDRYTIGPEDVEPHVDENTIGVAAVLGTTFTGHADDFAGINDLLVRLRDERGLDVPLHVDAASGGFVWPFLYPDSAWDFRLEQVRSINVSGHKFGLVYPGIGWLIFRETSDLAEDLVF